MDTPSSLPWFLESELGRRAPQDCLFHVIPVALEQSVSYGSGTGAGPAAILHASQQLETYDGYGVPGEQGIFTQALLTGDGALEETLHAVSAAVVRTVRLGKVPIILGGEHTVSVGAFHALRELNLAAGIVQFDAHADLRDRYAGSPLSHACIARRALDLGFPLFQVGVRSLSPEEAAFRAAQGIGCLDAAAIAAHGLPDPLLPDDFPPLIYLTIDLDVLDPAAMPATGTPEPGGLDWYTLMEALARAAAGRQVIGFDVVELAPIPGLHAPDFTAARLVYNTMGILGRAGGRRSFDAARRTR